MAQCCLITQCAGGYAWISAADTSLLDFPHCELLLIGAKPDTEGTPPCCDPRVLPSLSCVLDGLRGATYTVHARMHYVPRLLALDMCRTLMLRRAARLLHASVLHMLVQGSGIGVDLIQIVKQFRAQPVSILHKVLHHVFKAMQQLSLSMHAGGGMEVGC